MQKLWTEIGLKKGKESVKYTCRDREEIYEINQWEERKKSVNYTCND